MKRLAGYRTEWKWTRDADGVQQEGQYSEASTCNNANESAGQGKVLDLFTSGYRALDFTVHNVMASVFFFFSLSLDVEVQTVEGCLVRNVSVATLTLSS